MSDLDPTTAFPVPVPDSDTQAWWDACARRELMVQRCESCGRWIWQPRPLCWKCQTPDPVWKRVSGEGFVASWMVMRPPTLPAYADLVPYVILLVELDEGVRMVGYLVDDAGEVLKSDGEAEGIRIGARVSLRFHDQAGILLPSWTPVERG